MKDGLTFNALRSANLARLPLFKDARGNPCHTEPDGSDWSPADWVTAVVGELGEAANIIKKIKRGDFGVVGDPEYDAAIVKLRKEFADVICYMDLLAVQFDVNLGDAVRDKFNEVSDRVGANIYLHNHYWHGYKPIQDKDIT